MTVKDIAVTTVGAAILIYSFPQHLTTERVSDSVIRFGLLDAVLLLTWRIFIYPFFFSPLRHLPGPVSYNILIGNAGAQFSKPPGDHIRDWVATIPNDGLLRFRSFGNMDRLVPTTPEALKSVMSDNSYDFEKPRPLRKFLARILGEGLIIAEGGLHQFQRKHLLPAFQIHHIRELYPTFWGKSKSLVEAITAELDEAKGTVVPKENEKRIGLTPSVEFGEWATRITLDIIGLAGMGRDFNAIHNSDDELVRDYNSLLEPSKRRALYFAANIFGPQSLIQSLPFGQTIELRRITGNLKRVCTKLVEQQRLRSSETKESEDMDILSLLIRSNDFGDEELVDQLLTFLAAGHETTSSTLTWAMHLLATNQDWQTRLRNEIRSSISPLSSTESPTASQLEALPILNAVIQETFRLYPVVPISIRNATRDTTISVAGMPQHIPAGTRVLLVPWAINRSPHIWGKDSNEFKPDRWMSPETANTGGATNNYSNITFFHGPRSCIGQNFAKAEFKCMLAALAGSFKWEMADPNEIVVPAGVITTKPSNGMHLRMERVDGW